MRWLLLALFSNCLLAQNPVISAVDVEYSNVGQRVAMDIYRPSDDRIHPAVVLIHGGGFRAGNRQSYTNWPTAWLSMAMLPQRFRTGSRRSFLFQRQSTMSKLPCASFAPMRSSSMWTQIISAH